MLHAYSFYLAFFTLHRIHFVRPAFHGVCFYCIDVESFISKPFEQAIYCEIVCVSSEPCAGALQAMEYIFSLRD